MLWWFLILAVSAAVAVAAVIIIYLRVRRQFKVVGGDKAGLEEEKDAT